MATIYRGLGDICVKIAYCGTAFAGSAEGLARLHAQIRAEPGTKSELVPFAIGPDRTAYFTFVPAGDPRIDGLRLKVQVFALARQVRAKSTYELVLREADGIFFAVDSVRGNLQETKRRFNGVERALQAMERRLDGLPHVIQYDRCDAPGALSLSRMERIFNGRNAPSFSRSAGCSDGSGDLFGRLLGAVRERAVSQAAEAKTRLIG